MKRFLMCATMALCIGFGLDAAMNTGMTDDLKTSITQMDYEHVGATVFAATAGVTVVVPSATMETSGDTLTSPNLWVIPQAEYDALQARYRHLYIIDIAFGPNERYQFISRRPTKEVIQAVGESKDNTFKVADMMIKNMIVAGDMSALDDGVVYSHVIKQLTGITKDGKALFTKA